MKGKDKAALHTKTKEELQSLFLEIQKKVFQAKIDHSMGKLKNTRSLFEARKNIARILTLMEGGKEK